jgi:hypothetical protein
LIAAVHERASDREAIVRAIHLLPEDLAPEYLGKLKDLDQVAMVRAMARFARNRRTRPLGGTRPVSTNSSVTSTVRRV